MFSQKPSVIFLNGPSSAGKTTLAKMIQEKAPTYFLHFGVDKMSGMMPAKTNDWVSDSVKDGYFWKIIIDEDGYQLAEIQQGIYGQAISTLLKKLILTMLQEGHNVVIDEVCQSEEDFLEWKQLLSPYHAFFVGVTASLATLIEREKARQNRMLGSSHAQHKKIHLNKSYDLIIDTSELAPEKAALIILDKFSEKK